MDGLRAEATALEFNVEYQRLPFFLRGSQENIDSWLDGLGCECLLIF